MKRYILICVAALMGLACAQAQEVTIGSKADWDAFAARVNAGETSLNARMTADVLVGVTTMVGTQSNPYRGTFNGNGHTLTLALNSNARYCAPFSRVSGATIENLKTTGRVVPSGSWEDPRRHASGLVGNNDGGFTARNCWVAADIVGSTYSGGLLGHGSNSPFTMENCLFSGSNNATFNVGGLVGWCDGNCMPTITNCLNAGTFSYSGFAPIARVDGKGTVTNCYYTTSTSCSSELRDDRGTFTDKTGRELAQLLGGEWTVKGNEVVPVIWPVQLCVPDVLLKPGETASVGIGMNSEWTNLVSFQMDVYLPEGISVNKTSTLTSRFSSGELSIGRQSDGSYRLAATSYSLSPITGTEGDLVNLSLTASAGAAEGEATIRNIRFVTSSSSSILSEDVTFNIMSYMEQSIALTELPVMTYGDGVYTLPEETEQGMPIDWSVDNSAVAKVVGNNLMIRGAGTATVTAYQEGNDRYMELEKSYQLTVNKVPLTVTANSYTIEQGEALPAFEATYEGFVNNQSASALTTQPTFSCTAANSDVPGTYEITVGGAESQNYELTYVGGTLTITQQPASMVTAKSYTIKYGDPLPELEFTAEGFELDGTPELTCEATSASPVGTYEITVSKGSLKNYNVTFVSGTLTIEKAPLTVTAQDAVMTYGDDLPAFEASYEGFRNDDDASVLTTQPLLTTEATSQSGVGTYAINADGCEAQNYEMTYVSGTLTIEKAPLTITAKDCTMKRGEELPEFEASYDGFKNGETAEVLTTQPTFSCDATPSSNMGTYIIGVSGAEAENYEITFVSGQLTITQADPVTVTAKNYTIAYGDELPELEYTTSGVALVGEPELFCSATPTSPVGTYPITVTQGTIENYNVAFVTGTLTIVKAELTVTAKSYTIKEGDPLPQYEALYDGFKNNETESVLSKLPTIDSMADENSPAGEYEIFVGGARAQNYKFKYVNGLLTIEARADHDCATPTITYVNGKLVYECETEGATFRSTITCEDIAEHVGNEVDLTVAYHISVVASAEGYNDSEPATATLCWIDTEPVESVATGVLEIPGTPVLLKSSNGEISVEGLANGTQVAVYTAEGMLVGSEKVADGKVIITTSLMPGTVAIVRMGNKAVKMVVR
jgi:hypothetical protein